MGFFNLFVLTDFFHPRYGAGTEVSKWYHRDLNWDFMKNVVGFNGDVVGFDGIFPCIFWDLSGVYVDLRRFKGKEFEFDEIQ